ncbi:hypothetical protein DM01DRAFT_1339203 [Hesseltinella vesiculosa]|uniref:Post-SET domain-containing protein n=1 Tax=Hesseltinella vesiculosa TaxID=101127 RepID=A0A1X2G7P3_9FUNG|nr:hypothetical protein DM01DRAFT_1339203 [Hesseltinella vesiculosa]
MPLTMAYQLCLSLSLSTEGLSYYPHGSSCANLRAFIRMRSPCVVLHQANCCSLFLDSMVKHAFLFHANNVQCFCGHDACVNILAHSSVKQQNTVTVQASPRPRGEEPVVRA